MTPDEFRAIREKRHGKHDAMATVLGVDERTVRDYECGKSRVPRDIEQTLLRLARKTHVPCPNCRRTILFIWHDGLCGACTQPLAEGT